MIKDRINYGYLLAYFLIAYGIISTISICVFAYEIKHAYNIDPNAYFLRGDISKDAFNNKTK